MQGVVSIQEIATRYNVPRQTLSSQLCGRWKKIGPGTSTTIPESMESYLVNGIVLAAELGWPLNRDDIKHVVCSYCMLRRINKFSNGNPGKDWMSAFHQRWRGQLSVRAAETLTKPRAAGLTREVLDMFYVRFEEKLLELGIKDKRGRIFNLDETGLCTKASAKGLFYRRGTKEAQVVAPTEGRTMFTVLFCCSAGGDFLPPYVVYKGTPGILQTSWMTGAPPGTSFNATKSGWMEDFVFEAWFKVHFLGWLDKNDVGRPVMLIFDGHGSHLTYNMAQMAADNQVTLYCLPPHTSSKLQPLDVGVYGPLKTRWALILRDFYKESRMKNVTKEGFPSLLKKLFETVVNRPGNAVNAFASCGLCPLNRLAITPAMILPSVPYSSNDEPAQQSTSGSVPVVSPQTPHKAMRTAFIQVLSPVESSATTSALLAGKRQRRRVQLKVGECLTEPEALQRLKEEEEERERKKMQKKGKATPGLPLKGKVVKKARVLKPMKLVFDDSDEDMSPNELATEVSGTDDSDDNEQLEDLEERSSTAVKSIDWEINNNDKFVAAVYDSKWFIAVISKYSSMDGDADLRFMAPAGPATVFHWPKVTDNCKLPTNDILGILRDAPTPKSSRLSYFSITEETMDAIDAKYAKYLIEAKQA